MVKLKRGFIIVELVLKKLQSENGKIFTILLPLHVKLMAFVGVCWFLQVRVFSISTTSSIWQVICLKIFIKAVKGKRKKIILTFQMNCSTF